MWGDEGLQDINILQESTTGRSSRRTTCLGTDEVNGTIWGCCVQLHICVLCKGIWAKWQEERALKLGSSTHQATQRGMGIVQGHLPHSKGCSNRASAAQWEFKFCIKAPPTGSQRPNSAGEECGVSGENGLTRFRQYSPGRNSELRSQSCRMRPALAGP